MPHNLPLESVYSSLVIRHRGTVQTAGCPNALTPLQLCPKHSGLWPQKPGLAVVREKLLGHCQVSQFPTRLGDFLFSLGPQERQVGHQGEAKGEK